MTAALRHWFLGGDSFWRAFGIDTPVPSGGAPSVLTPSFTAQVTGKQLTVDGSASTATTSTITGYGWDFGDGTTGTGVTAAHTYASAGGYTVTLTVTDDRNGSATTSRTVTVSAPTAAYTWTASASTATFDASTSTDVGATITGYRWDFGDGSTGTGVTVSHSYATAGTRTVTLTVTDATGNSDTDTQQVTVNLPVSNPVAAFTTAVSNYVATFDGSPSTTTNATITAYAWTYGDGTTGTGRTSQHTYPVGSWTATLTITDSQGRTATVSHLVAVLTPPNQPPTAAFTATATNLTVAFSAVTSTDGDGSITGYAWTYGDGGTGTGVTPTHTYAAAGTYTVRLTVTDDLGAQGTTTKTLTVTAPVVKPTDYIASTTATKSSTLIPASTAAVLQDFVRSPDTGEFYSSQVHPETNGDESTRLSRMTAAGVDIDQMLLTGAGHGTVIALEYRSGAVWVWLTWRLATDGVTVVDDIVKFPYRAGTYTRSQVSGLTVVIPGGGAYRNVALDWLNGYAAIRTSSGTTDTYRRHKLADVLAGNLSTPLNTVSLRQSTNFGVDGYQTMQGFTSYAGALFRYTGAPSDIVGGDPARITEYDWATGTVIRTLDTSGFGDHTQKTEPEGLSVYDTGSNPVLFFGVTQGNPGAHTYPTWWYPLVDSTTTPGGGRQFDVGTEPWRTGSLTDGWPSTALGMVTNYVDHGLGFVKNLDKVIADYGGPCIVKLPAGTFHITSFGYSSRYGYFNANLRGLLGAGVTATTVKLDPGAMSSAQLADITANGAQGYHAFRIGSDGIVTYMAGIRWVGTDQPTVSILGATSPCPYNGLHLYHPAAGTIWQNFACIGFGRAGSNSPPFETGAIQSGIGAAHVRRFEIDGRLDASVNTTRPRRSGGWMLNQEQSALHEDGWIHHTGRSGYSFWGDAPGTMKTVGMQVEHDANQADDGFGGNRSFGVINHETNGVFTHDHGYWQRDNMANSHTFDGYGYWTAGPCTTKYIEPVWAGGPAVDNGCFSVQIKPQYGSNSAGYKTNYWYNATGGWSNVVVVKNGVTLKPHAVTSGSYTAATLQSAGVTAATHFLIKTS